MFFALFASALSSLVPTPRRYPGLQWGAAVPSVSVELFVDPLCPDCQAIWPNVALCLNRYATKLFGVTVHMLPLPYHTWSFLITRSIMAVKAIDEEIAKRFIDALYAGDIDMFQNDAMKKNSEETVLKIVAQYVAEKFGVSNSDFLEMYSKADTSMDARIEFKFAAVHSVCGTPTVYVNGVETEIGAETEIEKWFELLDPLF